MAPPRPDPPAALHALQLLRAAAERARHPLAAQLHPPTARALLARVAPAAPLAGAEGAETVALSAVVAALRTDQALCALPDFPDRLLSR